MKALPRLSEKKRALVEHFAPLAKEQAARFYRRFYGRMSMDELVSAAYFGLVSGIARWPDSNPPPTTGQVVWWARGAMWHDAPWRSALLRKTLLFSTLEDASADLGPFDPEAPLEECQPPPPIPETIDGYTVPRWLRIAWKWHVEHNCDPDTGEEELRRTLEEMPGRLADLRYQRQLLQRTLAGQVEWTIRLAHHHLSIKEIAAAVRADVPCVLSALQLLIAEQRVVRSGAFFDVAR